MQQAAERASDPSKGSHCPTWTRPIARMFHRRLASLTVLVLSLATAAHAQIPASEGIAIRSASGQFVVQTHRPDTTSLSAGGMAESPGHVHLDPTLLPIACERVKQILTRELTINSPWRGKIFVSLYAPQGLDDKVMLRAQCFGNQWDYQLQIPAVVERTRFVRALVSVTLLEMANRNAGERSAELPAWLIEGLTARVLAAHEQEVVLPEPGKVSPLLPLAGNAGPLLRSGTVLNTRSQNPLESVRQELSKRGALTFDELSWPTPAQLDGLDGGVYKNCAHLFVSELMLLQNGRQALGSLVTLLPENLNWQFAFLRAFGSRFSNLLDVEKWWSLEIVNFTSRELSQVWPVPESWIKVNQAVRCPVQMRSGPNQLPTRGEVSLQTLIRDWTTADQTPVLQAKLQELELLRMRVAGECLPVVEGYCAVLRDFLAGGQRRGLIPFRKAARSRATLQEALQRLDALDQQRPAIPVPAPAGAGPATAAPAGHPPGQTAPGANSPVR